MATDPVPTPALQTLLDALAQRPDCTAAELAAAAGIGRSTASKLLATLATLATQGRVLRQPGGNQGGRRTPDRWTLLIITDTTSDTTATSAAPPPAAQPTPAAEADRSRPIPGRLGAGQLRSLVEACLAQRPGQALSATAIAKALDRSAGAVANALQVLAGQGLVVQAQTNPRRYRIADTRAPAAATD
jgi:predicted transcriptional regulator